MSVDGAESQNNKAPNKHTKHYGSKGESNSLITVVKKHVGFCSSGGSDTHVRIINLKVHLIFTQQYIDVGTGFTLEPEALSLVCLFM